MEMFFAPLLVVTISAIGAALLLLSGYIFGIVNEGVFLYWMPRAFSIVVISLFLFLPLLAYDFFASPSRIDKYQYCMELLDDQ